jgi:MATE family, multidrug efflux pump
MAFLIAHYGTVAIAAYGVGFNVMVFVSIPAMGLSLGTATLIGQHIGAGKIERAERIAWLSGAISFAALTLVGVVAFVEAEPIVAFVVPRDRAVIAEGARFLRIVSISFGFLGAQLAMVGVFRAAGQTVVTMVLALVSQWAIQFPVAYALAAYTSLGTAGLWWSFPISTIAITIASFAWYLRGDWKTSRLTVSQVAAEAVTAEALIEEGL